MAVWSTLIRLVVEVVRNLFDLLFRFTICIYNRRKLQFERIFLLYHFGLLEVMSYIYIHSPHHMGKLTRICPLCICPL